MVVLDNSVRILAHALEIPLRLYRYGRCHYAHPKAARTIAEVLEMDDWSGGTRPAKNQLGAAQYLVNPLGESYIFFALPLEDELWIGPVLRHAVSEHRISEIIRRNGLPLRKKSAIVEHFAQLNLVDEDHLYHVGKLAELLVGATAHHPSLENIPETAAPIFSARKSIWEGAALFEHPPYFMELEMTRLVTSGDLKSALGMMSHINTFNRAVLAKDPVRSLKNSLICDCTFLARAAIAGGVSPDDAFAVSDRLIQTIEATHTIPLLEKLEREQLIEFVEMVHHHNTSYYSKPVREALSYIHNHLGEPLSLETVADAAGLSKNYFASLFKKETGTSPMQYVAEQRLEESKFFLRHQDDSILEIALFYQFASQSHFISRFKAMMGMTPLQYRKHTDSGRQQTV